MVERVAEIVILAEDLTQVNFARRYLIRAGHHNRNIRPRLISRGKGSGEQHVRERYPIEVQYYRSRASHRKAALIAAIDADTKSVDDRRRELDRSLEREGQAERGPKEAIVLLIPKRNIETWILCLLGNTLDELQDYKNRVDDQRMIREAADHLYEWSRPNYSVPVHCVPSLKEGINEVRRLE